MSLGFDESALCIIDRQAKTTVPTSTAIAMQVFHRILMPILGVPVTLGVDEFGDHADYHLMSFLQAMDIYSHSRVRTKQSTARPTRRYAESVVCCLSLSIDESGQKDQSLWSAFDQDCILNLADC